DLPSQHPCQLVSNSYGHIPNTKHHSNHSAGYQLTDIRKRNRRKTQLSQGMKKIGEDKPYNTDRGYLRSLRNPGRTQRQRTKTHPQQNKSESILGSSTRIIFALPPFRKQGSKNDDKE